MILRLVGIGLMILAILAIVGYASNAKQFGTKLISNKFAMYIIVLFIGLFLVLF